MRKLIRQRQRGSSQHGDFDDWDFGSGGRCHHRIDQWTNLYVAGTSPQITSATPDNVGCCVRRLDTVDLGSMTVTGSAMITDGYHDRIDISANGQLYIGSHTCTNIGNINNIRAKCAAAFQFLIRRMET